METAVRHIRDSTAGRNILTMVALRRHPWRLPLRLFRIIDSVAYQAVLVALIALHIALAFWEPVTQSDLERRGRPDLWVVVVEGCCLLFQFVDIVMLFLLYFRFKIGNFLSGKYEKRLLIVRLVLTLAVFCDWWSGFAFAYSFEYWFPLRPFLLLLRVEVMQNVTGLVFFYVLPHPARARARPSFFLAWFQRASHARPAIRCGAVR